MNEFFRLSVMMNLCLCVGLPSGHNSVCFCETLSNLKDVMYGFFFLVELFFTFCRWRMGTGSRPPATAPAFRSSLPGHYGGHVVESWSV